MDAPEFIRVRMSLGKVYIFIEPYTKWESGMSIHEYADMADAGRNTGWI